MTSSTGGVSLIWSRKLNSTAGRANWKRESLKIADSSTSSPSKENSQQRQWKHHATIELSTKVITSTNRLLNVLAHEFCHLTNFMLSNETKSPHGASFKRWAALVTTAFADRGIEVTTKHGYEIAYKYVWACERAECATEYKRHSKSVDPNRHSCGSCKGKLRQVLPAPSDKARQGAPAKALSEYQRFVKDNFAAVKRDNPTWTHARLMEALGREYRERKEKRRGEVEGERGRGEEGDVDAVARVLHALTLGR